MVGGKIIKKNTKFYVSLRDLRNLGRFVRKKCLFDFLN